MIKRLAIFPVIYKNNWLFRVSVSDHENILIYAMHTIDPVFLLRHFRIQDEAVAWIDECAMGKHIDI